MSKLVTQFVLLDEFHFDYNEASQNGVALFIFDKLIKKPIVIESTISEL